MSPNGYVICRIFKGTRRESTCMKSSPLVHVFVHVQNIKNTFFETDKFLKCL